MLGLHGVDVEVAAAAVLADDHALIDGDARADEQGAAILQVHQGIGHGLAAGIGQQHAARTPGDGAGVRAVIAEDAVDDAGSPGLGHEVAVIADQAARRGDEGEPRLAAARGAHVLEASATLGDGLDHHAGEVVVHIDDHILIGLQGLAGRRVLAGEHPGAAHGKLEAFAAHGLDEHAQLQLAAPRDLEAPAALDLADMDGDIALGLGEQAGADHPRGHLVAFAPGHRRIVDREHHGQGRRIDGGGVQGLDDGYVAQGIGDGGRLEPGDGDDIAAMGLIEGAAGQAAETENLGDAHLLDDLAVLGQGLGRHVRFHRAREDAPGQDAAEIGVGLQGADQHAEGLVRDHRRRRHMGDDPLEQGGHIVARLVRLVRRPALLRRGEENREIELLVAGVEQGEQIEDLAMDFERAGVGLVHLVDHDDRLQPQGQGLCQDEFGLRHGAFGSVDQQQHAVHHAEDALDLAAEIRMAGGVDDIDAHAVPLHRGAFGQDGDAALALQFVAVHDPIDDGLVVAEQPGLSQQHIDQGGLAVIDMGDDGDIANGQGGALLRA